MAHVIPTFFQALGTAVALHSGDAKHGTAKLGTSMTGIYLPRS